MSKSTSDIYQLRIVLRGVSPLVWRRLLVVSSTTVAELHQVFQVAFSWSGEHLHCLRVHGREYDEDRPGDAVRLHDLRLQLREKFLYQYNFTAGWEWEARIEAILSVDPRRTYPVCTGGRRATPPEECLGPWAYMERLDQRYTNQPIGEMQLIAEAMGHLLKADPRTPVREVVHKLGDVEELQDAIERLEAWDRFRPEDFDRRQVNARLRAWAREGGLCGIQGADHDPGRGRSGDPL